MRPERRQGRPGVQADAGTRISLPETIRFHDAEIDHDGILILDLRTARVSERVAKQTHVKTV